MDTVMALNGKLQQQQQQTVLETLECFLSKSTICISYLLGLGRRQFNLGFSSKIANAAHYPREVIYPASPARLAS
jgi:hypothetical protein